MEKKEEDGLCMHQACGGLDHLSIYVSGWEVVTQGLLTKHQKTNQGTKPWESLYEEGLRIGIDACSIS
jgi:hypothetical protein